MNDNTASINNRIRKVNWRSMGLIFSLIGLLIVFSFTSPVFLTYDNIINILRQISITAIISAGMFLIIVIEGIDLSVGSISALTGVTSALFIIRLGWPLVLGILMGLLIGVVIGFLNGLMVTYGKLPAFIATLATMELAKGLAFVISGGIPISGYPDSFGFIGRGYIGIVPWPVIILALVYAVMFYVIKRTKFGIYSFAIGGSEEASYLSGIKIKKNKIMIFVLSGLFASIAGIVLASRLNSGSPNIGSSFTFDAVTAVALGGTSMSGGEGKLSGVLLGSIFVGVLVNGMCLLNIDAYLQMVVQGIVLAAAMLLQTSMKTSNS